MVDIYSYLCFRRSKLTRYTFESILPKWNLLHTVCEDINLFQVTYKNSDKNHNMNMYEFEIVGW